MFAIGSKLSGPAPSLSRIAAEASRSSSSAPSARQAAQRERRELLASEARDLHPIFREAEEIATNLTQLEEAEHRRSVADAAASRLGTTRQETRDAIDRSALCVRRAFRRGGSRRSRRAHYRGPDGYSYFRDLWASQHRGDMNAGERLARHKVEVERDLGLEAT